YHSLAIGNAAVAGRQVAIERHGKAGVLQRFCGMLDELWEPGIAVRLIGVSVSGFSEPEGEQGSLFDVKQVAPLEGDAKPRIQDESKRRGLLAATDLVKDRFGEGAVRFGHELRNDGNTTGTAAKNPADYK
ncbi:MAG: hypothetical protein EGQ22_04135, partial [Senegalimassilia anaerobia]|nr:hypothetical protein [Senegalimassilia anaerobia]